MIAHSVVETSTGFRSIVESGSCWRVGVIRVRASKFGCGRSNAGRDERLGACGIEPVYRAFAVDRTSRPGLAVFDELDPYQTIGAHVSDLRPTMQRQTGNAPWSPENVHQEDAG